MRVSLSYPESTALCNHSSQVQSQMLLCVSRLFTPPTADHLFIFLQADADRLTSPGEGSINCTITPRPVGPLGIAQQRTPTGPSGAMTPQSNYSPLPPAHIAWPPAGANTPQSAHVPMRPVRQLNPNLFTVSGRKVSLQLGRSLGKYMSRWSTNLTQTSLLCQIVR